MSHMAEWRPVFDTLWDCILEFIWCIAGPLFLIVYGIFCIVTKHAYLPGRLKYGCLHFYDLNAILVGVACLTAGIVINASCCWNVSDKPRIVIDAVILFAFTVFLVCIVWIFTNVLTAL